MGTLAVDSIYTPVTKVNYQVEPVRVGSSISFDKLTLEILTNGTIIPEDALEVCLLVFDRTPKSIHKLNWKLLCSRLFMKEVDTTSDDRIFRTYDRRIRSFSSFI